MNRPIVFLRVVSVTLLALASLTLSRPSSSRYVSAHSGGTFGPACGAALINGQVGPSEWSTAAVQTFLMQGSGATKPFTTTLRVMNSAGYLYLGITIADNEFSTVGEFLPRGDEFRIDFDNDHSGSLFTLADDVLFVSAGSPQFIDGYISGAPSPASAPADVDGGGTNDGAGAASRVGNLNHFELRHPLSSGDTRDFALQAGDTVGFRLEYLDAEANGSFGGSRFYPGFDTTSVADIVIGTCSTSEPSTYLPLIQK